MHPADDHATKYCDELPPIHSITSSARASKVGGTARREGLGRREVYGQLEGRGLLHGQIGRLFTFQYTACIAPL